MTRTEIYDYYESKINNIEDEDKKDRLYELLEELDEFLYGFEIAIRKEIEKKNSAYLDNVIDYDYEKFIRSVRT